MLTTFYSSKSILNIAIIISNTIAKDNRIQIGDNTHHHDQVITLVNFNTIKAIVNAPVNPNPEPFEILSDIIKKI